MLRNWIFDTNFNFIFPISLPPEGVNLQYFKHRWLNLTEYAVWNIKGLRHCVAKI